MPMVYFGDFIKIMGSFVLGDWIVGNSTRTYNNVVFIVDRTKKRVTVFGTCSDEGEPHSAQRILK